MKLKYLMTLACCVTACAPVIPGSLEAACDATRADRAAHAAALADTPDEAVLQTGARLIARIDAVCANG